MNKWKKLQRYFQVICLAVCMICLFPIRVYAGSTKTYGAFKYRYNEELKGIEIVKYKGNDKKVTIPDEIEDIPVTAIGIGAFKEKKCIRKVLIPDTVYVIQDDAFMDCDRLEKVVLPEKMETLGECVFCGCRSLKDIKLSPNLTKISMGAFAWTGISAIDIPQSVTIIEGGAFVGCYNLKKIQFPSNSKLEIIKMEAFYDCWGLEEIKLPASLKVMEQGAFRWCIKLKKITFTRGSKLEEIGCDSFYNCYSLESVTIPKSVKLIDEGAFLKCKKLKIITFKGKAPKIGKETFKKIYPKAVFKVQKKYKTRYQKKLSKKVGYKETMSIQFN